jgi:hypothetical protein
MRNSSVFAPKDKKISAAMGIRRRKFIPTPKPQSVAEQPIKTAGLMWISYGSRAVRDFVDGGAWELVGEFVEVESGKRGDRPELAPALEACRKQRARLIIAKLDRLSRNLAFIATLIEPRPP